MSISIHPGTSLYMGDPEKQPLARKPDTVSAETFFNSLILSASGWRGVFGTHDNDLDGTITPEAVYVAGRMAHVFSNFLESQYPGEPLHIILGIDTRPSGPAIADAMQRIFLAHGITVHYGFIMSAPEIMAAAYMHGVQRSHRLAINHQTNSANSSRSKQHAAKAENAQHHTAEQENLAPYNKLHGFCYISASHNPPGHNGVKFGLGDGGVLSPEIAKKLIASLQEGACTQNDIDAIAALMASVQPEVVSTVFASAPKVKRQALSDYLLFSREIFTNISLEQQEKQETVFNLLADETEQYGIGIVAELNGSSRSLSIDENFITSIGARYLPFNNVPGHFVHRIVPEGESLTDCTEILAREHAADDTVIMGYVPDCDGDRGNIVIWDEELQQPRPLEAQETFALTVLLELASLCASTGKEKRIAVVCNDATSLRIEAIAQAFGATVFRTETGEANVVSRACELREAGWEIRILGEGSNGGVIIHPSRVRDPLSTIGSLIKITVMRNGFCPFKVWLEKTHQRESYFDTFTLSDVAATLPAWTTTSVFETRAALTIKRKTPIELKQTFFANLPQFWDSVLSVLQQQWNSLSYEVLQSSGTTETSIVLMEQIGKGGLKILIKNQDTPIGFLWMRESGTEPLFRIMADIQGDSPQLEAELLELLTQAIQRIDS